MLLGAFLVCVPQILHFCKSFWDFSHLRHSKDQNTYAGTTSYT